MGVGSGGPSALPSPRTAKDRAMREHDPSRESLAEYMSSMERNLQLCAVMDVAMDLQETEKLMVRAKYLSMMQAQEGPQQKMAALKRAAADLLVSEDPTAPGKEMELSVVMGFLRELGLTSPGDQFMRMFSTSEAGSRALPGISPEAPAAPRPRDRAAEERPALGAMPAAKRQNVGFLTPKGEAQRDIGQEESPEVSDLLKRLEAVERNGSVSGPKGPTPSTDQFAAAMDRQTEALKLLSASRGGSGGGQRSTIRVNPTVRWPQLNDDDNEIEEFFESFDLLCGLANDGAGMRDTERLTILLSCLKGAREKVYKVIYKLRQADGKVASDPEAVFGEIKKRLLRFRESEMEKQTRVLSEWEALLKTKNETALQFEPRWEKTLADLARVGLGCSSKEMLLAYIKKVGPLMGTDIRKDSRAWPDGDTGLVTRRVATWEEAHQVCLELETLKTGTRALASFAVAPVMYYEDSGGGKGKGRGSGSGIGKGKGQDWKEKPCFEMRDSGTCSRGEDCRFSHAKKVIAAARQEKQQTNAYDQAQYPVKGGKKGRGRGKGKGGKRSRSNSVASTDGGQG